MQIEHHVCGMEVPKLHLAEHYEFIPASSICWRLCAV
jgi:hypothetical protein